MLMHATLLWENVCQFAAAPRAYLAKHASTSAPRMACTTGTAGGWLQCKCSLRGTLAVLLASVWPDSSILLGLRPTSPHTAKPSRPLRPQSTTLMMQQMPKNIPAPADR